MGIGTKLNRTLCAFIERQLVFFVATAAPDGRVNVSPKGMSRLRILGDTHIRWLNPSGSSNETAVHLRASNRRHRPESRDSSLLKFRGSQSLVSRAGFPPSRE